MRYIPIGLAIALVIGYGAWNYAHKEVLGGGYKSLDDIVAMINKVEDDYYKVNGIYWQGLPTSTEVPKTTSTPDKLTAKTSYQDKGWADFITLPDSPYQFEINQYKGPKGLGYWILVRQSVPYTDNTTTTGKVEYKVKTKSYGYGPDADYLTHDWL